MQGRFPIGSTLPGDAELMELFGVSRTALREALKTLAAQGVGDVRLLGPAEAPVFRLKGYYRYHFQLQSPSPGALHKALRAVMPTLSPPSGVEVAVDVDPSSMQ